MTASSALPGPPDGEHRAIGRDARGWFEEGCWCPIGRLHAVGARGVAPEGAHGTAGGGSGGPVGAPGHSRTPDAVQGVTGPHSGPAVGVGAWWKVPMSGQAHLVQTVVGGVAGSACGEVGFLVSGADGSRPMRRGQHRCQDCQDVAAGRGRRPSPGPAESGRATRLRREQVEKARGLLAAGASGDMLRLRVEHPDATLAELAAVAGVTKHALATRLRRQLGGYRSVSAVTAAAVERARERLSRPGLSPVQEEALRLRVEHADLPVGQVAALAGVSPGVLGSRLTRALSTPDREAS